MTVFVVNEVYISSVAPFTKEVYWWLVSLANLELTSLVKEPDGVSIPK